MITDDTTAETTLKLRRIQSRYGFFEKASIDDVEHDYDDNDDDDDDDDVDDDDDDDDDDDG